MNYLKNQNIFKLFTSHKQPLTTHNNVRKHNFMGIQYYLHLHFSVGILSFKNKINLNTTRTSHTH